MLGVSRRAWVVSPQRNGPQQDHDWWGGGGRKGEGGWVVPAVQLSGGMCYCYTCSSIFAIINLLLPHHCLPKLLSEVLLLLLLLFFLLRQRTAAGKKIDTVVCPILSQWLSKTATDTYPTRLTRIETGDSAPNPGSSVARQSRYLEFIPDQPFNTDS